MFKHILIATDGSELARKAEKPRALGLPFLQPRGTADAA